MTGIRRLALRVTMLLALLAIAGLVAWAPTHRSQASPYASAITKLVVRDANASPCPIQKCAARGNHGFVCVHNNAFTECLISSSGTCNTQSCVVN